MIAERLHKIAAAEKVNISNGAISAIARAADGGMRDAQSLLDQMIAFFSSDSNSDITEEQALSLFGLTSAAELQDFIKAMLTNNRGGVVYAVHQLAVKGKNLETLFNDTLVWLRGIQLCALLDDPENVLEIDKETSARFKSFGSLANQEIVQTLLETLSPVGRILHDALNKQVFLETIILKAMREAHAIKIEQLIERLNVIRKSGELEIIEKIPAVEPAYKYAVNPPPAVQTTVHEAAAPVFAVPPAPAVVHAPAVPAAPAVPVEPPPPAVSPLPPLAPESPSLIELEPDEIVPELIPADREDLVDSADLEDDDFTAPVSTMALVEDKPVAASPANVDNTKESREIWHRVIEAAEGDRRLDPVIYGYMREAAEVKLADNLLTVFYDEEFEPEHIAAVTKNITHLCRYLQRVLSVPDAEVKIELLQGIHAASGEKSVKSIMNEKTVNKVKNNPQVKVIVDLFDGEIVDIHG
jgi:DNA polymerase-3 subunit gamma/tau